MSFTDLLFKVRASGSDEQQAELLESFRDYLRTIARQRLQQDVQGVLSVSDLVQSALIDAQRDFSKCRAENRAEFKAWLRQILLNDIVSRYRHLKRQKRDVRRERPMQGDPVLPSDQTPSQQVMQDEDERRLLSALDQLDEERRQVVEWRHRDNLTFVEIGRRLERSPDAVRMIWNRAIEQLAKALKTPKSK